eukprot:c5953_g1_i1.p1 GENE.c5953_g1_i1~~c5953_g1_i1.p1  ORF type:complete len:338 (-),score=73.27 c5953_g1_i1:17-1030(-)
MFFCKKKKTKDNASAKGPRVRQVHRLEEIYVMREELGKGGFAVVKKAVDPSDNTMWAIKIIQNSVFKKTQKQTEDEVAVLSQLSHPGIVKIREVVQTDRTYCIVMELLSGGELFERIVDREKYTEADAKHVVRDILEAVAYLHDKGVVHRDLKPENLIFVKPDDDANLKITDFGFATVMAGSRRLTLACGTPDYVAPEIVFGHPYTQSVDMWSLGVIVYILLCGFPPFFADDEAELFEQIKLGEYKFLSPYWDSISMGAKSLVSGFLTVNPSERLTAREALQHPWFKETASDSSDLKSTLGELQRFNAIRKLRKGVVMVVAAQKITSTLNKINNHHS